MSTSTVKEQQGHTLIIIVHWSRDLWWWVISMVPLGRKYMGSFLEYCLFWKTPALEARTLTGGVKVDILVSRSKLINSPRALWLKTRLSHLEEKLLAIATNTYHKSSSKTFFSKGNVTIFYHVWELRKGKAQNFQWLLDSTYETMLFQGDPLKCRLVHQSKWRLIVAINRQSIPAHLSHKPSGSSWFTT